MIASPIEAISFTTVLVSSSTHKVVMTQPCSLIDLKCCLDVKISGRKSASISFSIAIQLCNFCISWLPRLPYKTSAYFLTRSGACLKLFDKKLMLRVHCCSMVKQFMKYSPNICHGDKVKHKASLLPEIPETIASLAILVEAPALM